MGKVADLSVYTPGGQPGAPNPSEGLAVLRQNQTAFMETIGVMPPESLTIADGAISPTTAVCIVDTEGSAPADDLTTINATLSDGSTLHDGMVILLSAKDASRVVTVKNSDAPNGVKTVDGKDIALSPEWSLVLQYVGGVWQQINVAAPLRPATDMTLGGVKVGDGLTMQDGVMSADLATDKKAGRVKASETALAGVVPVGGVDGALDEKWLKAAMEAAGNADKKATYTDKKATYTEISTRSTTGQWTITGCTIGKPLFIMTNITPGGREWYAFVKTVSGVLENTGGAIGVQNAVDVGLIPKGNVIIVLPSATTVVIEVNPISSGQVLYAIN